MDFARRVYVIAAFAAACSVFCSAAVADPAPPIDVEIQMPDIPTVGGEAVLDCTLESARYLNNVSLTIELPDGVEAVEGDLNWQGDLIAFQQVRLGPTVKITGAGNKKIKAVAFCRVDENTAYADTAEVFFHSTPVLAVSGHVYDVVSTETPCVSDTGEISEPTKLEDYVPSAEPAPDPPPCPYGPGDEPEIDQGPAPNGTITVSGSWYYYDRDDVHTPMEWVHLQLLRGTDNAELAYTWILEGGDYTFPAVTNPGSDGFKVRVRCYFNSTWACDSNPHQIKASDGGDPFTSTTSTRVAGDGAYDMGTYTITNGSTNEPAWWLMQDLMDGFWWPWWLHTDHSNMPGGATVIWSSTSTTGNYNNRGGNIYLKAANGNICDTLLHEYGHEVQWDGYGGWLPSADCPSPHYFELDGGPHCAWYEGFASWYKCVVSNDPSYHWPDGGSLNLENPTWGTYGWDDGDECEGRVTGALWDFGDPNVDGIDTADIDWVEFWDTWYGSTHRDDDFSQFWTRYKAGSGPTHHATKALWQSTIDYNSAPTFSGLPDRTMNEDATWNNAINLWIYAYDPESSDFELEYTINNTPASGAGVSIDSGDYVDIYPLLNWYGSTTVQIRCSDGIPEDDKLDSFVVTVNSINDEPELSGLPDEIVEMDSSNNNIIDLWEYAYDVETSDSGLTYTITGNTDPNCGVLIDAVDYVDVNPTPGWMGYSDVTIRATDPQGAWDEDTFRIMVVQTFDRIADARDNPNGTWVRLTGKAMTALFADHLYIEEFDRSSGIRGITAPAAAGLPSGEPVPNATSTYELDVAGPLSTSYAERQITLYHVEITDIIDMPEPVCMSNETLGGNVPDAYTAAVPVGGHGLYNVGLLVRTAGRVVRHYGGTFYIDDGSPTIDSWAGNPAVLIDDEGLGGWVPPLGSYVSVTGLSGATTLGGNPIRILRPRSVNDIVIEQFNAAYVYYNDPTSADSWESLLDGEGIPTDQIYIKELAGADWSKYHIIILGTDTPWASSTDVDTILNAGTPVVAVGEGGSRFLDEVPDLHIGWGHSWTALEQSHAHLYGGDIYSYPYDIPYSPPSAIYLYYDPGVTAQAVYDPDGVTERYLRQYGDTDHFVLAGEQDRFYQWGFHAAPSAMTGYGRQVFINLLHHAVRQ